MRTTLFYLILTNILGGSSYAATGYALRGLSAVELVFWRTLLGCLAFIPFFVRALKRLHLRPAEWFRVAAVAFLGYAAPLLIGTLGQETATATNAALLIGMEPVSIVILSAIFLGEALTLMKVVAVASGLSGAGLIVLQGMSPRDLSWTSDLQGNLLLFLHGFFWSLYSVIGKPLLRKIDPMSFTALTTVLSLIPITGAALPELARRGIFQPSGTLVAAVLFLGLGVTFYATFAWNKALELAPASQLAQFIFIQPLVGVVLGVCLLRDRFTLWSGIGGVMILWGVYASMRESPATAPNPTQPSVL
ncbi:MAG: DMT family transporter [Elusimicrobia bacterium]|nr:DMT family transporter [Elusimicrobiota bacterium]